MMFLMMKKLKVALIVYDNSYGTKLGEQHIPGYIEFSYRYSLNEFAKALGIESQYVEGYLRVNT